jgi:hypothetical protein
MRVAAPTLAALLLSASTANAASQFTIDWYKENRPGSCVVPGLEVEGQANFDVNDFPIPTYTQWDTLQQGAYGAFAVHQHAPFSGTLLQIGTNSFYFGIGENQTTPCLNLADSVRLYGPGVDRLLFTVERIGDTFSGTTSLSLSLREIDPSLANSLDNLRRAIADARASLLTMAADADIVLSNLGRLDDLERALDHLLSQSFDELSVDELDAILSAYDDIIPGVTEQLVTFLSDLHANVEELRVEIARLNGAVADQIARVPDIISASANFDPTDPRWFEPVDTTTPLPEIDVPDILGSDPWDETNDPYRDYADEIVGKLSATIRDGVIHDRAQFLEVFHGWRTNVVSLQGALERRFSVSAREWAAFITSKNRVLNAIEPHIDNEGWLRDAPIPPNVRAFVSLLYDIKVVQGFRARAEALQWHLNQWRGHLTERQQAVLDIMLLMDELVEERLAQDLPEQEDEFWPSIGDVIDGAIALSPAGDFMDACAAITGRENCNPLGRELSFEERVYSAAGVVVGSGAAWKAAAAGVGAAGSRVLRRLGDVLDELPPRFPDPIDNPNITEIPTRGGARTFEHASGWQVRYNRRGFPDFRPYRYTGTGGKHTVRIQLTGSRGQDFKAANKKAGFGDSADATPAGYTWHHHEDMGKMILVQSPVHRGFAHNGGVSVWQRVYGQEYRS